jgi:hypothetical protein
MKYDDMAVHKKQSQFVARALYLVLSFVRMTMRGQLPPRATHPGLITSYFASHTSCRRWFV